MSKNFVDPYNVLTEDCHNRECAKKGKKLFFTGIFAYFFKNLCFQQPLRCYRNDLLTSRVLVRIPCEPFYIVHYDLLQSIMTQNLRQFFFLHWKVCLFFRKIVFSTTSWCYRIIPVTSTVVVKKPCGAS